MTDDNKLLDLYKKYDLSVDDRIIAGHLVLYINSDIEKSRMDLFEELLKDEQGFKDVLDKCIKYYKKVYDSANSHMDKLLYDSYITLLEECRLRNYETLSAICKCIAEYY